MKLPKLPRYIALCGNPKSGKSEAQRIMQDTYGVIPVDDGLPLREFAVNNCGCTWQQVSTQSGKAEMIHFAGKDWVVRDLLGTLGNHLEAMFGKDVMPAMAIARIDREQQDDDRLTSLKEVRTRLQNRSYSFGSVRRDQGLFYKERGGRVFGIRNPGAGPSNYEFDRFDESVVDVWIENDGLFRGLPVEEARRDLALKIHEALVA